MNSAAVAPVLLLAPYLLGSLALAGALAFYLMLQREMKAQARRNRRVEAMLMRLGEASLGARPGAASRGTAEDEGGEAETGLPVGLGFAPVRPVSGMNLNRRVQALRLLRRGEDAGYIASALAVPRCEVDLLVRVQRMAAADRGQPGNGCVEAS
jgi:hypothetical protein